MVPLKDWRTRAEISNYVETSRHSEAIAYSKRLEKECPWFHYEKFGVSPEGRDLPLLVVSKKKHFTPQKARKSDSVVLLIINGIHPGEIAGKEASFALLRDIGITKEKSALLDRVILLVVPIYNVDGHERISPYNRINQNGPREMGWRGTSHNMNLNRDWMKADQPEAHAMLRLFSVWLPDFVIDNHVSDGADFQYDVTWLADDHSGVAEPVLKYFTEDFEPFLLAELRKKNHVSARYFEMKDATDPSKGVVIGPIEPRFSHGYSTLQNRPSLVVETHMLKDFRTRIIAHYDLMEAALTHFNNKPDALRSAVRKADSNTLTMGPEWPIRFHVDMEHSEPYEFHGVEYTRESSPISGTTKVVYGKNPVELNVPSYTKIVPEIFVRPPLGYIVPRQWTKVLDCLKLHDVKFELLKDPVTAEFETYRFENVSWAPRPFESHHRVSFRAVSVRETRTLTAGSALVWLNQRTNKVILGLLEPDSPDSLISWGYFDAIFEEKEYAEHYILEILAAEMSRKDEKLKQEFQKRVDTDEKFAGDPGMRLRFFYERSPYFDPRKDCYPIVRIDSENQVHGRRTRT